MLKTWLGAISIPNPDWQTCSTCIALTAYLWKNDETKCLHQEIKKLIIKKSWFPSLMKSVN